jgi:ribosomal protein S4
MVGEVEKYNLIRTIYFNLRKKGYSEKEAIAYIYRHKIHNTKTIKYLKEHLREVNKQRQVF